MYCISQSETLLLRYYKSFKGGFFGFFTFMYVIPHCFICRPSDYTVLEDAGIESKAVATLALTARRSNHLARSHLLPLQIFANEKILFQHVEKILR
jgi:hypothetical protein